MSRFKHGRTNIYNLGYHIIWTPKYRYSILKGNFKIIIENSIFEKCNQLDIVLEEYEIMPDHVHLFLKCKPNQCISNIVKELKGYSSYKLRSLYPKYRKYKAFWSPSYYCESVGHISETTIRRYIENQTLRN